MRPIDPLAQQQANDPATTPEQLSQLLTAWPELDEVIARHPNAYDAMLGWIAQHGSSAAQAVAAQRMASTQIPPQPQMYVQPQMPPMPSMPAEQAAQMQTQPYAPQAQAHTPPYGQTQPYGQTPPYAAQGEQPPTKRSRKGLVIGLVAALVVVLGGGAGLGIWALTRGSGGAESPEAVLANMVKSIENKDLLGLSSSIAPSEQKFLQDVMQATTKLQPSKDSPDILALAQKVMGTLSVTENTLTTSTREIATDVVAVEITGGSLVIDADPAVVADAVTEAAAAVFEQQALADGKTVEEMEESLERTREDLTRQFEDIFPIELNVDELEDDVKVAYVAVKEGGWFLSPLMTSAEFARMATFGDDQTAELGTTVYEAKHFGSATEAADGFFNGVAQLLTSGGSDIKALAETLPLAERRLVSIYGPAFFNPDTLGVNRERPEFAIDHVKGTESSVKGFVRFDLDMKATVTTDDGYEGTIEIKDSCIWISETDNLGNDNREGGCLSDVPLLKNIDMDSAPLVVINENGGWLVSPFGTLTDYAARFAVAIQPCLQTNDFEDLCAA